MYFFINARSVELIFLSAFTSAATAPSGLGNPLYCAKYIFAVLHSLWNLPFRPFTSPYKIFAVTVGEGVGIIVGVGVGETKGSTPAPL